MRYPIRARVLKRDGHWLVVQPSGTRRRLRYWHDALGVANMSVGKEREYTRLKEETVSWTG